MKSSLLVITLAAFAGVASAAVNPTRPMVTGRGNVDARPAKVIVTNQTAEKADESIKLEKFVVTGSLLPKTAQPKSARK